MALPPLADILALFPDNITGDISAADARSMITDLYNQISANETDIAARLPLAGGSLTGDLISNTTFTLSPTQLLRWRAQNTNLGSVTADNAGFLILSSLTAARISSPRIFVTSFDDDVNIGKNLELAADGEIIVGSDVGADFSAALASHIGAATPPFQHVATDVEGLGDVVADAEAAAQNAQNSANAAMTDADDADAAAVRAEAAAQRAEAAAGAAGVRVGEMRWFIEDPASPPTRTGLLRPQGQLVNRADYPLLYDAVVAGDLANVSETQWQAGQRGAFAAQVGETQLRLPDLRGYYIKVPLGDDPADSARTLGTRQNSNNQDHTHTATQAAHGHMAGTLTTSGAGEHMHRQGLGFTGGPADTKFGSLIFTGDPTSTRDEGGSVIPANQTSVLTNTVADHTHTISGSVANTTPPITVDSQGLTHANVRNVWVQPYIVTSAGTGTETGTDELDVHFTSVVTRDAYFAIEANRNRLINNLVVTLTTDTNDAVSFYIWRGGDAPTSYNSASWLLASVDVPAGSVTLGGVRVSEGGNGLVITNNGTNRTYLAQGGEFNDMGSVATNNLPVLAAVTQIADPQLVNTDTFTGQMLAFPIVAPSDFLVKEFDLDFNGAVNAVTVTIYQGNDNTGPQIVSTTFDAADNINTLTHDSNPRFITGNSYFVEYSTTSPQLNIRGDNSGMTFMPYFITRGWPYSETTNVTTANIAGLIPGGTDVNAIHDNVAGEINAIAEKVLPIGSDILLIEDSADSFNKKKILASTVLGGGGVTTDAVNVLVNQTNLTGIVNGATNVQVALERIDATGIGAEITQFTGSFSATNANIATWFNNRALIRLRGIGSGVGDGNGAFTFDLPGTSALNSVFDQLVTEGLPERFTLVIEYTGGTSDAVLNNRLVVQPRVSPSPQIDGQTNYTLLRGQTVTLEITRTAGTISDYLITQIGLTSAASSPTLGDIELRDVVWDASANGPLPTVVLQGYAFRVINAPLDGSGRFGEVMQNDDWIVWFGASFTSWSAEPHQWFVIAGGDVRRITQLESEFLNDVEITPVSDRNAAVRGADYSTIAGEIRFQIYASAAAYDPSDLNTNGDIDEYQDASDQTGRLAIRLPGQLATIQDVLPTLFVYRERAGVLTRLFNLSSDFTHQGDFATESDYLSNFVINYTANDILRVYATTVQDRYTIPDLDVAKNNLTTDVQNQLDAQSHGTYSLPPALAALNNQASVFNITHSNFRINNDNVFLANAFAFLKNMPTTLPPTAGQFANEINGSAQTVDDPVDLTRIQNVGSATNNILTGVGINGNSFGMNFQDRNNWHLVLGGWMYYETLPTSFTPILRVAERAPIGTVYRDIFGIDSNGIQFKVRNTTGTTVPIAVRHPLSTTDGFITGIITASVLTRSWRIYTAKTYFVQVSGFNGGMLTGAQAMNYTVTDIDVDQAPTTLMFNLGVGTQSIDFSFVSNATLYGGSAHEITADVSSLIVGVDEIRIQILDAETTVTTSTNNTYTDASISEGHVAASRLMRYIASFRSVDGIETGDLECVLTFFGYDDNGNPAVFDENTFELQYPALDLEWDDCVYGGQGIHQNVQGFFLNPDTPLLEFPRHSTLRDWIENYDDRVTDWAWRNVDGPDQDTEVVNFPEFVTFENLILVAPDGTRFQLSVLNDGTIDTKTVT